MQIKKFISTLLLKLPVFSPIYERLYVNDFVMPQYITVVVVVR